MTNQALAQNGSQPKTSEPTRAAHTVAPRVDIFENDHELTLYADLPGVAPDGVDLRYERGELTLHGTVTPRAGVGQLLLGEYSSADFHRVFQVHETIDASKIEAEHRDGVLTVHLPKQEAAKPKQVTVKVA